jgi:hypothetical protein
VNEFATQKVGKQERRRWPQPNAGSTQAQLDEAGMGLIGTALLSVTQVGSGSTVTALVGAVQTGLMVMGAVSVSIAGVCIWTTQGAMSPLSGAAVGLGSGQSGLMGGVLVFAGTALVGLVTTSPGSGSTGRAHTHVGWVEMGSGCTDGVVVELLGMGFANAVRLGFMGETGAGSTGMGSAGTAFANAVGPGSTIMSLGTGLTGVVLPQSMTDVFGNLE